ncbi:MAG: CHASE2 domain-containing protein, partial [Phycisphaerae bacterium]
MRMLMRWIRAHILGLAVGLVVTLTAAASYQFGLLEWMSLKLLNYRFKHFNRVVADNRVVMIDITDYALERVHKWPWPRQYHAYLIDTLTYLGARATLMDIVFAEAEAGRFEHPKLDPDYEIDDVIPILGETAEEADKLHIDQAIWDDRELETALRRNGQVFIAMFARLYSPQFFPDKIRETVYEILDGHPGITFEAFQESVRERIGASLDRVMTSAGRSAMRNDPKDLFDTMRIEHLLEQRFDRSGNDLAERLGVSEKDIDLHLAGAKRNVARRLVARARQEYPKALWPETFTHVQPEVSIELLNADRLDLLRAFRAVSSRRSVFATGMAVPESLIGHIRNASD